MWSYKNTDEIYHHGVKGMRWGVRKIKKAVDEGANATRKLKEVNDASIKNTKRKRMNLKSMSDQEMRSKINRELLERQYNDLFAPPSKAEKGKKVVSSVLSGVGNTLVVTGSALGMALTIKELLKK